MRRRLKILVLVDEATVPPEDSNFEDHPDSPITEYHVIGSLRDLGHEVSVLGVMEDVAELVKALSEQKADLVFNLTEHFGGERRLDKNIVGLLELLGIPFTGSGIRAMMLCRDKALCKELLGHHRIRVPGFVLLPMNRAVRVPKTMRYPLVVKPALEDGSEGISNASLVTNEAALAERAEFIYEGWEQPVIAEEYIEGRELYVTVSGNKRLAVYPPRECFFNYEGDEGPALATYRVKWNKKYREKWNITFGFAELEPGVFKQIERVCRRAYRILHIQDYGRIDLRLTPDGKVVVLEANPNPDLAYGEEVAESAERAGLSYDRLIDRIVNLAMRRYK
ncbi:MAG: D-alanine--D-alanine ligase family protein [Planctomycetota bacterium]|jgi:D-alanine-D-alanine ligase